MALKENGAYIARGLSFQDCTFDIIDADIKGQLRVRVCAFSLSLCGCVLSLIHI